MLYHREGQELLKECTRAIYGTEYWDILHPKTSIQDEREFEKYLDQLMLTYAKAVVAEMGPSRAEEFLDPADWQSAVKDLAARKDLNKALEPSHADRTRQLASMIKDITKEMK